MKFKELADPEISVWLVHTSDGLIAYRDVTPKPVMKLFERINNEYREIFGRNFISILEKNPE